MDYARKVYVEGADYSLSTMFNTEGYSLVDNIFEADLLCAEGGADVSPELYGEENTQSHVNRSKDVETFGLMTIAEMLGIPIVGVCRGSQALCVFEGGKLKQHINNHGRAHSLNVGGTYLEVSSTHHQESVPASDSTDEVISADDGTVEVVKYSSGNLGCQFHPEYFCKGHECWELFFSLVDEVCFKE